MSLQQPSELSPSHPFGGCQLDAFYIMWLRPQRTFFKKALLLLLLSCFSCVQLWATLWINQRSNCKHPLHHEKSKRVPNIYLCSTDYAKAFDCVDHNKLWNILKEMGIPDQLTCLWNLYAGQEATVRTGHGTTDWFQIGKGVRQGCILLPCLFNLHAEHTIRNIGLDEAHAGIKIARKNINNLKYADDTTLMA